MKFEIKNRWTGNVQFVCELDASFESQPYSLQLGTAVKLALKQGSDLSGSNLRGSDLRGSDLRGSDLSGSNLSDSNLRDSNLSGSNLSGSNLSGSDLRDSNLRGSNLSGSNLSGSDLSGSNLSDSNLRGSDLSGSTKLSPSTRLDTGETWQQYLDETLRALLTATGKTIEQVVASGCWDCHSWSNCPMHEVFGAEREADCPILLRPRVRQFVQFFDAGLIPCPVAKVEVFSDQNQ